MSMETQITNIDKNVVEVGNDLLKALNYIDTLDSLVRQVLSNQNALLANQKLILDELRKK